MALSNTSGLYSVKESIVFIIEKINEEIQRLDKKQQAKIDALNALKYQFEGIDPANITSNRSPIGGQFNAMIRQWLRAKPLNNLKYNYAEIINDKPLRTTTEKTETRQFIIELMEQISRMNISPDIAELTGSVKNINNKYGISSKAQRDPETGGGANSQYGVEIPADPIASLNLDPNNPYGVKISAGDSNSDSENQGNSFEFNPGEEKVDRGIQPGPQTTAAEHEKKQKIEDIKVEINQHIEKLKRWKPFISSSNQNRKIKTLKNLKTKLSDSSSDNKSVSEIIDDWREGEKTAWQGNDVISEQGNIFSFLKFLMPKQTKTEKFIEQLNNKYGSVGTPPVIYQNVRTGPVQYENVDQISAIDNIRQAQAVKNEIFGKIDEQIHKLQSWRPFISSVRQGQKISQLRALTRKINENNDRPIGEIISEFKKEQKEVFSTHASYFSFLKFLMPKQTGTEKFLDNLYNTYKENKLSSAALARLSISSVSSADDHTVDNSRSKDHVDFSEFRRNLRFGDNTLDNNSAGDQYPSVEGILRGANMDNKVKDIVKKRNDDEQDGDERDPLLKQP